MNVNYMLVTVFNIIEVYICYSLLNIFFKSNKSRLKICCIIVVVGVSKAMLYIIAPNNVIVLLESLVLIVIVVVLIFKKLSFIKKLYIIIMYSVTNIILELVITFIVNIILGRDLKPKNDENFILYLTTFIFYSIQFIIINIIKGFVRNKYTLQGKKTIYLLQSIIPILSIVFVVIFTNFQIKNNYIHFALDSMILVVFSCINFFSLNLSTHIEKLYAKYNETELINMQLLCKEKHYIEIEKQHDEIRRVKHDFMNHLSVIKNNINTGYTESAINIINSIESSIQINKSKKYASNITINTIFSIKESIIQREMIDFTYNVKSPYDVGISDKDLVCMLGNLFDNAIESCKKCAVQKRKIDCCIVYYNGVFIVEMVNSVHQKVDDLVTSKKNKTEHGLGLKSIYTSIQLYDGVLEWRSTDELFYTKIILCAKK